MSRGVLLLLAAGSLLAQQIQLEGPAFKLVGWEGARHVGAEAAREIFAVYVDAGSAVPPILGSYRVEAGNLIFEPRFPLQPGLRYRAVFRPPAGNAVEATFDIPKREGVSTARVVQVYPSTSRLPENQLKFYIHFSAPMSRGDAYRRVRLLDQSGRQVALPFLELDEELWDREGKRLTIFFDPGRIKSGLAPREEAGSPIEAGKAYTLVIDREWLDAGARPLQEGFAKSFHAGPADRTPPDPKTWVLKTPKAGTSEPLSVEFPKPMDHALLSSLIEIADPRGKPLAGTVEVDREETRWRFTPSGPWKAGEYFLTVGMTLEDLAGNTIGKPFEVDVFERVEQRIHRETIRIPFTLP